MASFVGDSSQNVQFPPFRNLQDFCLDSARFQLPSTSDQNRWSNRVINNLLYYQSNYFVVFFSVLLLIGLIYPSEFLQGLLGTICAMMAVVLAASKHHAMRQLRTNHPWALLVCLGFLGYMAFISLRCMAVFAFPFAISVLLVFIHASLRTRNIANRISNKAEQLGIRKTPMGMLMELTGYEIQFRVENVTM